jgi:hypothetical protein
MFCKDLIIWSGGSGKTVKHCTRIPKIKGISINNSEFLISQYADDSTLSLADDENSLNEALNTLFCTQLSTFL